MHTVNGRSPLAIHVDLDGATHIFRAHSRSFRGPVDSVYASGMQNMLALFEAHGVRATLFVIAEDARDAAKRPLIAEALARGHELASHTMTHPNLLRISSADKERELVDSKALIEDTFGTPVTGFRAPGYAMDAEGLGMLGRAGYVYDSSAFPTPEFARRLQCTVDELASPRRFERHHGIIELPLPGPAPRTMPLGPSLSLAFALPAARWTLWRAAQRGVPTALLFHLIDFAEPLPRAYRDSAKLSLFTLSTRSAAAKQRVCSGLLRYARARFHLTPTLELLAAVRGAHAPLPPRPPAQRS
jgi:peptidoglycan/xylan/chitin deacetylase (PgdA/CDA1 family)